METRLGRRAAQAALAAVVGLGCAGSAAALALAESHAEARPACAAQKAGWKKGGGKWWYAHAGSGYAKGWEKIAGKWYLFDKSGWMQTGWRKSGGKWYYLKASGAMATGWQKVGGKWYWLGPDGAMRTGWAQVGKKWYLLGGDGAMRTGWRQVGKEWYYLEPSGAMAASKWVGDYYLASSGAMATSQWVGKYWVGADGKWVRDYKQPTAKPNPASDFEYVVGDFYDPQTGEVGRGSCAAYVNKNYPGTIGDPDSYGPLLSFKGPSTEEDPIGVNEIYNFGRGVYITGYKGDLGNIVVPNQINGQDVVFFQIGTQGRAQWGQTEKRFALDVSQCAKLQGFYMFDPCFLYPKVTFGKDSPVQLIDIHGMVGGGCVPDNMDLRSLSQLKALKVIRVPRTLRLPASLEYFGIDVPFSLEEREKGLSAVDWSNCKSLRAFCGSCYEPLNDKSLVFPTANIERIELANYEGDFDLARFPKLRTLAIDKSGQNVQGLAKLQSWGAESGHQLTVF